MWGGDPPPDPASCAFRLLFNGADATSVGEWLFEQAPCWGFLLHIGAIDRWLKFLSIPRGDVF